MTSTPDAPVGTVKKAGQIVFGVLALVLVTWGLWLEVRSMARPFAYFFGRTAQGTVLSTHTFRMSLWATVRYPDAAGRTIETETQVLDFFDADLTAGADVTVHYLPWLTSEPCVNRHVIPDLLILIVYGVLGLLVLILPFGLWQTLTRKRTSVG